MSKPSKKVQIYKSLDDINGFRIERNGKYISVDTSGIEYIEFILHKIDFLNLSASKLPTHYKFIAEYSSLRVLKNSFKSDFPEYYI